MPRDPLSSSGDWFPGEVVPPTEIDLVQAVPGTVVFRLAIDYSEIKSDDLYRTDEVGERLNSLRDILSGYGTPPLERAVRVWSAETLWSWEVEVARRTESTESGAPARSLTRYWRVRCGEDVRPRMPDLVERLQGLEGLVEVAYIEARMQDPGLVGFSDEPLANGDPLDSTQATAWQGYHAPSPVGVNARYAWDFTKGEGVSLVDLEQMWFDAHEDLDLVDRATGTTTAFKDAVPLLLGDNAILPNSSTFNGTHGASVCGVIFGRDNGVGGVGLAPGVDRPARVSYRRKLTETSLDMENYYFVDAMLKAIRDHLGPGDVLVIEAELAQGTLFEGGPTVLGFSAPVETQALERDVIQLAVSQGVVVVEAAGNGGKSLDDTTLFWGDRFVNGGAQYEDSGAIMVGASVPTAHTALEAGNRGTRVDCFAWGQSVRAPGSLSATGPYTSSYRSSFDGTSAATAIIAGVAVLVQSYYKAQWGSPMNPMALRDLLRDQENGLNRKSLGIGVMPDLSLILPKLASLADVFLRDNTADTGVVPSSGTLSSSPDIIVRQTREADPDAAFGEDSANRDRVDLGQEVRTGHDHYIYVRASNRGTADATSTSARIYWSPPATLVTPDLWTEIGSTPAMTVPQGGTLHVSDPLVWRAADLPGPGHYCFVGVLGDPQDPAPPAAQIGAVGNISDYLSLVRDNNNIAWRNFNVVTSLKSFLGTVGRLPFLVVGPPGDEAERFELELLQRVPVGSQVFLQLNRDLKGHHWESGGWLPKAHQLGGWAPVGHLRRVELGTFRLQGGARYACQLGVMLPKSASSLRSVVVIRQLYKGMEVGRITWQFGAAHL